MSYKLKVTVPRSKVKLETTQAYGQQPSLVTMIIKFEKPTMYTFREMAQTGLTKIMGIVAWSKVKQDKKNMPLHNYPCTTTLQTDEDKKESLYAPSLCPLQGGGGIMMGL